MVVTGPEFNQLHCRILSFLKVMKISSLVVLCWMIVYSITCNLGSEIIPMNHLLNPPEMY